jgi:predicted nucleotidyltransferase
MRRDEVLAILVAHRVELAERGVASLALFGSVARDEASPGSDVDLLVEFNRRVGLFAYAGLQRYLEELLARPVDLVTPETIKPRLRERILGEAVRVPEGLGSPHRGRSGAPRSYSACAVGAGTVSLALDLERLP